MGNVFFQTLSGNMNGNNLKPYLQLKNKIESKQLRDRISHACFLSSIKYYELNTALFNIPVVLRSLCMLYLYAILSKIYITLFVCGDKEGNFVLKMTIADKIVENKISEKSTITHICESIVVGFYFTGQLHLEPNLYI